MMKWLLLASTIALEVASSLALSVAIQSPGWYVVVAAGYIGSFLVLPLVLKRGVPLGVAYGIWSASGVLLIALLAALIFGDPLTPTMLVGIALIVVGVLAVEIGSQHAAAGQLREHGS